MVLNVYFHACTRRNYLALAVIYSSAEAWAVRPFSEISLLGDLKSVVILKEKWLLILHLVAWAEIRRLV